MTKKSLDVVIEEDRIQILLGKQLLMDVPLDSYLCTDSRGHKDLFGWTILEVLRNCYMESVDND